MTPINNNSQYWPPIFDRPPSPLSNTSVNDEVSATKEFILQCLRKERATKNEATVQENGALRDSELPLPKRAKKGNVNCFINDSLCLQGILRNNNTGYQTKHVDTSAFTIPVSIDDDWHNVIIQNNLRNASHQAHWRQILSLPMDLSRDNRAAFCSKINSNSFNNSQWSSHIVSSDPRSSRRVRFLQHSANLHQALHDLHKVSNASEPRITSSRKTKRRNSDTQPDLDAIKENLHSRAQRKITRIATWNINNGFDHLAIASIMVKKDIDILALQEPRVSNSAKDDVWIATMRKELRKSKLELITTQFSYLVFDEQTSGAALASIVRQTSKIQGRLLSVTFKTDDLWEVHTVISIYAVTNPKSTRKYANSRNSRKDVNVKLTKALHDELHFLRETFGEAPINIIGDFQDTIHDDHRDNIGMIGKKMHPNGPLYSLINEGFVSAFHQLFPNAQQVTRWNSSKSAGRHIDLQMLNSTAASLLQHIEIDDQFSRNHIASDHLIVIADFNIGKKEQDIVDCYRTRINFNKIAGIRMKCTKRITQCPSTSNAITSYDLRFDDSQFMSCIAQNSKSLLEKWQHHANSSTMHRLMTKLENLMTNLEQDTCTEDRLCNEHYISSVAFNQRKLVERNLQRRAQLDLIYNEFQDGLVQIASALKIITCEDKQKDALCLRQRMKLAKTKHYGDSIINMHIPTSMIRSALGDLKNAEATLRNLAHHAFINPSNDNRGDDTLIGNGISKSDPTGMNKQSVCSATPSRLEIQQSFTALSKNLASLPNLKNGFLQLSDLQKERIHNEAAISHFRPLDSFSGRWNECSFSSSICSNLLYDANNLLKNHGIKQRIGFRELDQTTPIDDSWSSIDDWWNGPDLLHLASATEDEISSSDLHNALHQAISNVRKLRSKAYHALIHNKETNLLHDARMNHTRNISLRLNPRLLDEPEAHHVILNPNNIHEGSNMRCEYFQQCLDNTLLYHQNLMDRSGSEWEHHWFQLQHKYGHVAGIHFKQLQCPKPSELDFNRLVKNHETCSDTIRKAFQDAHSHEIFQIMRPPERPHKDLDWLWHPSSTDDDWHTFESDYWKAISAIPGKARHAGYTMAVIGRLPRRWIDLHLRIMKAMMVLRILPQKTKIQTRVPIPKPKPGETRPLSLLHDDMCFILGFITKHYTLRSEKLNLFPPSLRAYRQGMGTSAITLLDLAMREDAVSFGRLMALTAEDEEKFFDRVSLEVQLAVLVILGFPIEGFLEMKAEEMDNIVVEIHTRHGKIIGKFLHGLKQGSPISVLMSNYTLLFKHRIWGLRDPEATAADPNGYAMTVWNKAIDGAEPPIASIEGFCDDNSKWNMGNGYDFKTIVQAIKWNIKMAGDLSMIFKIGRRGDKTIIELFNVDFGDIYLLPEEGFTSIAWDFKANKPTQEEVDCRVYLNQRSTLPLEKPESISPQVWNMLLKGKSLKSERSLGIWRNQLADTTESAKQRAFLLGQRIDRLNLSSIKNDKTIKLAVNSLVVPVYQFGILENKCCPKTYDAMDIMILNKIRQAIGYAWCDAKQLLFVSEANFGMGINSVSALMLKSISRELEIQLNDDDLLGKVLRGRLEAFKCDVNINESTGTVNSYEFNTRNTRNFLMEAIRHIAAYGLFVRDMTDIKTTYQIESAIKLAQDGYLFRSFKHATLGMQDFSGTGSRSGTTLGSGDARLLWGSIYGRGHMLLQPNAVTSKVKMNFSTTQLASIYDEALSIFESDLTALYTVFEWSAVLVEDKYSAAPPFAQYCQSINQISHWNKLSAISCLEKFHDEHLALSDFSQQYPFLHELLALPRDELLQRIDQEYINPNRLVRSQIAHLLVGGWPLIVANDGGAKKLDLGPNACQCASAGVVILQPPELSFADYMEASHKDQITIMTQNLIPWKARASPLPPSFGNCATDNAHAECMALILLEEWLPRDIPVLLIMDSEAERGRYLSLRNKDIFSNRFLIRSIMSGVSKCLGYRLAHAISYHYQTCDTTTPWFPFNTTDFYLHARSWCFLANGEESLWKTHQWDSGHHRTVWAIRSHQLEESFSVSPKNRYGSNLVPNRSFVSANQWADNVCNALLRFQRNAFHSRCPQQLRRWIPSKVSIGITGPIFIITYNGVSLDRSVSTAVEDICDREFIRRVALRPTQGLIIRLSDSLFIKPEMIGRQSYLRRSLEGKTKTHTRAMYTDTEYRQAIIQKYAIANLWDQDSEKIAHSLKHATKTYEFLRCPCCIDIFGARSPSRLNQQAPYLLPFRQDAKPKSGFYGNLRHYRFYCLNENIQAIREEMNQILEDHLGALLRIASNWGRLGFSTLLNRATDALITLDRRPFHNALENDYNHVKLYKSSFACLNTEDWLSLVESFSTRNNLFAHNNFRQWPLLHQFGFIPANCYTQLEMEDGEYSPCDLISMGIIPNILHDTILQFAGELGARHSQAIKKDFLIQWQQVRAVALLRAISITMAAGAHVADYKRILIDSLPASNFQTKTKSNDMEQSCALPSTNVPTTHPRSKEKKRRTAIKPSTKDCFPCTGITCSSSFMSKTNLRPSSMCRDRSICRRCSTMRKAIDCANSIELCLVTHPNNFKTFYTAVHLSKNLSVEVIITAISKLHPRPPSILPSYLLRSTKRNVYPTIIMHTIRLLCGTFGWTISEFPTSLDLVFNQTKNSTTLETRTYCTCEASVPFFSIDYQSCCNTCGGSSIFVSTVDRIRQITNSEATTKVLPTTSIGNTATCIKKNIMARVHAKKTYPSLIKEQEQSCVSSLINNGIVLKDITNLPNINERQRCMARPNDSELGSITHVNYMLSNFIVSYFFKIFANRFSNILFTEFLFDFVKRDGGWKNFVESSRRERHYTQFFERLLHPKSICIIPICCNFHWTVLVRRYIGNSWKILFIDSFTNGSDKRFRDWQSLFSDEDLFSGEWIKVKIFPQRELECGARVCLHGVCFALSKRKSADIIGDISRFKDLSVRSRLMVSTICKDGIWSHQNWLSRTIGNEEQILD